MDIQSFDFDNLASNPADVFGEKKTDGADNRFYKLKRDETVMVRQLFASSQIRI